jgi:hypothetical protein
LLKELEGARGDDGALIEVEKEIARKGPSVYSLKAQMMNRMTKMKPRTCRSAQDWTPCCASSRLGHRVVTMDEAHPTIELAPSLIRAIGVVTPPCHYRAIHCSLDRSPADTHGQSHGCRDLLSSSSEQVAILPYLALQAAGRGFESHHLHHQQPGSVHSQRGGLDPALTPPR